MSKRAKRRHHRARIVARAVNIRRLWWGESEYSEEELHRFAAKYADNLAACSCITCGNPRRHGGAYEPAPTRQERLSALRLREEIDELEGSTHGFDD